MDTLYLDLIDVCHIEFRKVILVSFRKQVVGEFVMNCSVKI